jgi:hypothetical protein
MHAVRLVVLLSLSTMIGACSKSSPQGPSTPAAEPPTPAVTNPSPSQRTTPGTTTAPAPAAAPDLAALTHAARQFAAERRKVPGSLEELAAAGYLKQVPQAPPGKQFLITPRLEVVLQ